MIERQLRRIRVQRAQLEDAERFLVHVINCEHDLLTRCEACTRYAASVHSGKDHAADENGHPALGLRGRGIQE